MRHPYTITGFHKQMEQQYRIFSTTDTHQDPVAGLLAQLLLKDKLFKPLLQSCHNLKGKVKICYSTPL